MVDYDESKRHNLSNDSDIKSKPLDTFVEHFPTSYLDSKSADLAIYLGGYDADGNDHGAAYSYLYGRHAWAQMVKDWYAGGWTYDGSRHSRRVVTIHELGHFFDADHQGSDGYRQAYDWWSGLNHYYTVMWSTNKGSKSKYEFSSDDYNGDSTHDNARRINETKGVVADYNIGDGTPCNPWDDDGIITASEIISAITLWSASTPPAPGCDLLTAKDIISMITTWSNQS